MRIMLQKKKRNEKQFEFTKQIKMNFGRVAEGIFLFHFFFDSIQPDRTVPQNQFLNFIFQVWNQNQYFKNQNSFKISKLNFYSQILPLQQNLNIYLKFNMKPQRTTSPMVKTNNHHNIQTYNTDFNPNQSLDNMPLNMNFNGSLEEAANYYCKQANKLYFANLVLNNQLKSVIEEKNNLALKLAKLEKQKGQNAIAEDKKKRHRRTANQIQRGYKCPVQPCQKSYGSEGSLSQHLKLKHNEFYKAHINSDLPLDSKGQDRSSDQSRDKKSKQDIVL